MILVGYPPAPYMKPKTIRAIRSRVRVRARVRVRVNPNPNPNPSPNIHNSPNSPRFHIGGWGVRITDKNL